MPSGRNRGVAMTKSFLLTISWKHLMIKVLLQMCLQRGVDTQVGATARYNQYLRKSWLTCLWVENRPFLVSTMLFSIYFFCFLAFALYGMLRSRKKLYLGEQGDWLFAMLGCWRRRAEHGGTDWREGGCIFPDIHKIGASGESWGQQKIRRNKTSWVFEA